MRRFSIVYRVRASAAPLLLTLSAAVSNGSARGAEKPGTFQRKIDLYHGEPLSCRAPSGCERSDRFCRLCGDTPLIERIVTSHLPVDPVKTLMKATV